MIAHRLPVAHNERVNLSVNEFCARNGISRSLFYDEVRRGELWPIKVGKRTLVPVREEARWHEAKASRKPAKAA